MTKILVATQVFLNPYTNDSFAEYDEISETELKKQGWKKSDIEAAKNSNLFREIEKTETVTAISKEVESNG